MVNISNINVNALSVKRDALCKELHDFCVFVNKFKKKSLKEKLQIKKDFSLLNRKRKV